MPQISRTVAFDAGIELITLRGDTAPEALPERPEALLPGAGRYSQQINELLFPPSVEQSLLDSFRPELTNRAILNPVENQIALQASRTELARLANESADSPQAGKLQRAADELQSGAELLHLLTLNRHLLHKA